MRRGRSLHAIEEGRFVAKKCRRRNAVLHESDLLRPVTLLFQTLRFSAAAGTALARTPCLACECQRL